MSDDVPYQLAVHELEDALYHILRMAQNSRSQTKRIRRIALRAEKALNGEVHDQKESATLPKFVARQPMSYETEIRILKRQRDELRERLGEVAHDDA